MTIPEPPENTRAFYDPEVLRKKVLDNAKESYEKKLNTLESNNFKLKVTDLHYPEPDKIFPISEQKSALLEKRDLTLPLKAKVSLINKKDNTVVDSKETVLARVPWITERNSTILHGVEGMAINQARLASGVFSRRAKSGMLESQVNIESGSGVGGKVVFNPTNQTFYYQIQNSKFHLYSLFHDMGISDTELLQDWGTDLLNRNRKNYSEKEVDKLYNKLFTR